MYCIQCGVKLADTEKACPLCGTVVFHPDFPPSDNEPLYPKDQHPKKAPRSIVAQMIATVAFMLPLLTVLVCDWQINKQIVWSGYVIGALILSYVMFVLPSWFRRPNPVIFVPCSFAALLVYVLYIDLHIQGGWFLTFAFPVIGGIGLIVTAVITLLYYLKRGQLFVLGGAFMLMAGFMVLTEYLAMITFAVSRFIGWSLYPLTSLFLIGGLLIFLGIYRPAREAMERKFFL